MGALEERRTEERQHARRRGRKMRGGEVRLQYWETPEEGGRKGGMEGIKKKKPEGRERQMVWWGGGAATMWERDWQVIWRHTNTIY